MVDLDNLTPGPIIKVLRLIYREEKERGYLEIYQCDKELYQKMAHTVKMADHTADIIVWTTVNNWVECEDPTMTP